MSIEDFTTLTTLSVVLTNDRVSQALSEWFGENMTFTRWEYAGGGGTEKGDSFLSESFRVKIYGANKENIEKYAQILVKCTPKNESRRVSFRIDEFFQNEINFYTICLPALLKFQASKKIRDPFKNYAKLFFSHCDGFNDVICLEDGAVHNFGGPVITRQQCLDYDHCKVILKAQAQLHAMSIAMKDQEPKEFEDIKNSIFETLFDARVRNWYEKFWKSLCDIAIDAVEKEYPNTIYVDKVKSFAVPECYMKMIRAVKTYNTGVISHGDSWASNFLYRYENGKVIDVKIIDFQTTRCSSPVLDVSFLIFSCTDQELRLKYYDELLEHYYQVLSTQITEMGSDPDKVYSWNTFMREIKKYSYYGLALSFESTPFVVLDAEESPDLNNMEGTKKRNIDDFWNIMPFQTKEGRLREANNVVFCVDREYI